MGGKNDKEEKKRKKNGRLPCCEREGLKVGAWTPEEDKILVDFIIENGHGTWRNLPKLAGLLRCGKSCRLRWINYLRPDIKRGPFTLEEENTIMSLHEKLGNKWAAIACHLPGRTDNDVKNYWNSHLRKRLTSQALDHPSSSSNSVQWENVDMEAESHPCTAPLPLTLSTQSISKPNGDYFIRLWNSEVGESFRNINESTNEYDGAFSYSPTSQTSSLTKAESSSRYANQMGLCEGMMLPEMADEKVGIWNCKKESEDLTLDDSSDAMLKLLLDFPVGENDMGLLQRTIDDVYIESS